MCYSLQFDGKQKGEMTSNRSEEALKRHFLQRNFLYSENQFRFSPQALENWHCNATLWNFTVLCEHRHTHAINVVTSESRVCRLILTSCLFVKFLYAAYFSNKASAIFWMTKTHSLALWVWPVNGGDVEMVLEGAADSAASPAAQAFLQGWHQAGQWASHHRLPWGGKNLALIYHNCSSLNIHSERDLVQIHNPSTSVGSSLKKI